MHDLLPPAEKTRLTFDCRFSAKHFEPKHRSPYYGWIAYNDKVAEGDFAWEDGCTSSYTNWDAGPPQEPNNDPNFGGEDCTIKWNDGTTWNDVPCDFTYPCYCQDVKGGGY